MPSPMRWWRARWSWRATQWLVAKYLLVAPLVIERLGRRIGNIERFSGTRVEVVPVGEGSVQVQIRLGLHPALCEDTQHVLRTSIPRWSVSWAARQGPAAPVVHLGRRRIHRQGRVGRGGGGGGGDQGRVQLRATTRPRCTRC